MVSIGVGTLCNCYSWAIHVHVHIHVALDNAAYSSHAIANKQCHDSVTVVSKLYTVYLPLMQ